MYFFYFKRELQGCSAIGRVVVSKTIGWGFESLRPCHFPQGKKMANPFSKIRQYYRETVAELKKVSWPNGKEIRASMVMVFVSLAILGVFLGLADFSIYNVIGLLTDLVRSAH